MTTLREAVSQLDAAIQHLEKAVESGAGKAAGEADGAAADLRATLDDANSRNQELAAVADQVALRLDRAVAQVTAILES